MKKIIAFFLLVISTVIAEPISTKPYIFLSIPKSGTFLLHKLLTRLSSNSLLWVGTNYFDEDGAFFPPHKKATLNALNKINTDNESSLFSHFNFLNLFLDYSEEHPEFVKIGLTRDLRDVCVSTTYFIDEFLSKVLGENASFDEKLLYVIECENLLENSVFDIQLEAEGALQWFLDPNVHICKFENLCGSSGGGDDVLLKEEIQKLAQFLEIPMTNEGLRDVMDGLWGNTPTFRKGQIGDWKKLFKPIHTEAFNKRLGELQLQLGYEL